MEAFYLSKNKVPYGIKVIQCQNHKQEQSHSFPSLPTIPTHGRMSETEKPAV